MTAMRTRRISSAVAGLHQEAFDLRNPAGIEASRKRLTQGDHQIETPSLHRMMAKDFTRQSLHAVSIHGPTCQALCNRQPDSRLGERA
jgi:Na+/phosphate symporter